LSFICSLYWWFCCLSLFLYIGGIVDYHSFFILVVLLTITRSLYWWYCWLSLFLYIGGIVDYHSFFILVVLLTIFFLYIGGIVDYHSFFILVVLLTITRFLYWWYCWLSLVLYIVGIERVIVNNTTNIKKSDSQQYHQYKERMVVNNTTNIKNEW
jgi:hypothetical protein